MATTPPRSHDNPLIEDYPADTLRNTHYVLSFLEGYTSAKDLAARQPSQDEFIGLSCILRCVTSALLHEIPAAETARTSPG